MGMAIVPNSWKLLLSMPSTHTVFYVLALISNVLQFTHLFSFSIYSFIYL